jgi:hypothetical protein
MKMRKRFYLTLDQEKVEELQTTAKSLLMSPDIVSIICDEAISKTLDVLKLQQSKGALTLTDLFTMIGKETQAIMDEEIALAKKNVQPAVGKKAVTKGKAKDEPVHKQRSTRV